MALRVLLAACCVSLFAAFSPAQEDARCALKIELVNAKTGKSLPGLVNIRGDDGKAIHLDELVARGRGVREGMAIHDWFVLPKPAVVKVPRRRLRLKAFFGLESEFGAAEIDVRGKTHAEVKIPLKVFYHAHEEGYQSANTHVHLQRLSRPEANRYLLEVSRADDLDIVYISYLERAVADLQYTTNKYTLQDLKRLSNEHVHFDNGQEHRHNFTGFGEGYGHVMLLHLPELIQPVSIGPGIMKKGTDGIPLRRGILKAREMGSKVIWCHNKWGLEDIPNWLSGKLHANNIFDGGTHGSYKHSFYRYLNAGLRVPFSTGTDWFIYDFSRVYVPAPRPLTSEQWLDQLAAGRSYITNGPFLEFTVAGRRTGDTVDLKKPGKVKISARALGRTDFAQLQLVRNGRVIHQVKSQPVEGHFKARIALDLDMAEPCWLALRTPPPSTPRDPEFQRKTPLNAYGRELFSHTSAVYVTMNGKPIFQRTAAQSLLDEMKKSRATIIKVGLFASGAERKSVISVYDEAIEWMTKRLVANN